MLLDILTFIAIGLAAGWLAGFVLRGRGFGWRANLVIGVLGALAGGILFPVIGLTATGLIGRTILATAGAIGLLIVLGMWCRSQHRRARRA
jgi:uncharacterized membrane protein YeaQ/YmgE (transglycosylase-associated protein family)